MSNSKNKIEAERKHRYRKRQEGTIVRNLLAFFEEAHRARQLQVYLNSPKPSVTERVRREKVLDATTFVHTRKVKCEEAANTNREHERNIRKNTYKRLIKERALTAFGMTCLVKKDRLHFHGEYDGYDVTICLDHAWGPKGIKLGRFVEFETMVKSRADIKAAQKMLKKLAREVLPRSCKREHHGYKTLALEAMAEYARQLRREKRKAKKGK